MKKKNRKELRLATVTLKVPHWNGKRKLSAGEVFDDPECYEGKYNPNSATVVFAEIPEPVSEPEPVQPHDGEHEPKTMDNVFKS